jgi:hypothetical protein
MESPETKTSEAEPDLDFTGGSGAACVEKFMVILRESAWLRSLDANRFRGFRRAQASERTPIMTITGSIVAFRSAKGIQDSPALSKTQAG